MLRQLCSLTVFVRPRIGKFALQNRLGKPVHKSRRDDRARTPLRRPYLDGELRSAGPAVDFERKRSAAPVFIRPTPTQHSKFKFYYVRSDLAIRESTAALRQAPARRLDRARRGGADLTRARARADGARRPQWQAAIEQPCRWQRALQDRAAARPSRDRRRPRRPGDRSGWPIEHSRRRGEKGNKTTAPPPADTDLADRTASEIDGRPRTRSPRRRRAAREPQHPHPRPDGRGPSSRSRKPPSSTVFNATDAPGRRATRCASSSTAARPLRPDARRHRHGGRRPALRSRAAGGPLKRVHYRATVAPERRTSARWPAARRLEGQAATRRPHSRELQSPWAAPVARRRVPLGLARAEDERAPWGSSRVDGVGGREPTRTQPRPSRREGTDTGTHTSSARRTVSLNRPRPGSGHPPQRHISAARWP